MEEKWKVRSATGENGIIRYIHWDVVFTDEELLSTSVGMTPVAVSLGLKADSPESEIISAAQYLLGKEQLADIRLHAASELEFQRVMALPTEYYSELTPAEQAAASAQKVYEDFKDSRDKAVSELVVEVDGLVFDGDEDSQNRMARVIAVSSSEDDSTLWRLANNTTESVTVRQLKAVLKAASIEQTALWMFQG